MLIELHHFADGREVAVEQSRIVRMEAHVSGAGTLVVFAIGENSSELHVSEPYSEVKYLATESTMTRVLRKMAEDRGETFDRERSWIESIG